MNRAELAHRMMKIVFAEVGANNLDAARAYVASLSREDADRIAQEASNSSTSR